MARAVLVLLLGLAATALAHSGDHSDDYTSTTLTGIIPFNPTEAPNYASTGSLDYHISSTSTAEHSSTSCTRSHSHSSVSTAAPASSAPASGPQTTLSATPTTNTPPVAASTTQTVLQVSGTGAARANYPEFIGAVAGGLIAGLALS